MYLALHIWSKLPFACLTVFYSKSSNKNVNFQFSFIPPPPLLYDFQFTVILIHRQSLMVSYSSLLIEKSALLKVGMNVISMVFDCGCSVCHVITWFCDHLYWIYELLLVEF